MHYAGYLRQRYAAVLSYIGGSLIVVAALFLLPLLVAPFYPAESRWIPAFIGSALPMGLLGFVLWRIPHSRQASHTISVPEGAVVVVLVWLLVIAFGAIPFVATMRLRPHLALFESVSGFTTTGLSVSEPERTPRTLLSFRSLAQLIGGAGFALIVLSSIIPGPAGGGLFAAEGRSSRFVPNIRGSGNIVLRIYLVYTVTGAVALRLAGMGWFDAVNHAFASISTGGFSTRTAAIGHWNSAAIEAVVAVLMFLGSFNFMTAYALYRGRFRIVARNGELRFGLALLAVALLVVLAGVGLSVHAHVGEGLRASMFEVISALASTGFASTNMLRWPDLGWLVIVGLMLIGGGAESTAGGIKQFRIYVLLRSVAWEIRQVFQPRHAVNERDLARRGAGVPEPGAGAGGRPLGLLVPRGPLCRQWRRSRARPHAARQRFRVQQRVGYSGAYVGDYHPGRAPLASVDAHSGHVPGAPRGADHRGRPDQAALRRAGPDGVPRAPRHRAPRALGARRDGVGRCGAGCLPRDGRPAAPGADSCR